MDDLSYNTTPTRTKRKVPKRLIIFIIFFVIILALIGGLIFFVTRDSSDTSTTEQTITLPEETQTEEPVITQEETPTPEETEAPTKAVSPTKAPTPSGSTSSTSNSSVKVAIQNGSGESGVAGTASNLVKEGGFTVASTGNADNFDYEDVTIKIKASKKSFLSALEDSLSGDYTIGATSSDLPESTTYDALVIIGK